MNAEPIPIGTKVCSRCGKSFRLFTGREYVCPPCRRPRKKTYRKDVLGRELTSREMQVAALIHQDRTYKEIGAALGIDFDTAKVYGSSVVRKLGVKGRVGVALWYERREQWADAAKMAQALGVVA